MPHEFTTSYLADSLAVFRAYKAMGERAMAQLGDDQLQTALDPESNSIAVIVKHLAGNMRSRWTDFLTSDGEKADRNRDSEFETPPATRDALMEAWEAGWRAVFCALEPLTESDLARTVYIRQEPHSVTQAITRQLAHYACHIGQIVFLAKHLRSSKWESLSIPRAKSAEVNAKMAGGRRGQQ